jgi:hypothetical protein
VSAKKKARRTMSDEHKQTIADARRQNQAVRRYLNALTAAKPAGQRPTTAPEQLQAQIDTEGDPVKRLELNQRRLDLEGPARWRAGPAGPRDPEAEFIAVADDYASRKGITYSAFRELGVRASALKRARIPAPAAAADPPSGALLEPARVPHATPGPCRAGRQLERWVGPPPCHNGHLTIGRAPEPPFGLCVERGRSGVWGASSPL